MAAKVKEELKSSVSLLLTSSVKLSLNKKIGIGIGIFISSSTMMETELQSLNRIQNFSSS